MCGVRWPAQPAFDLDAPWQLHPQVSIRPERFGALLYHFGTRRLSFLKSRALLAVVSALGSQPTAQAACCGWQAWPSEMPTYCARPGQRWRRRPGMIPPARSRP